ncbi:MAG: A/G-specific adenine glycosylase [Gemmatimonadota bacterium]|nr:A/G-specific adenine glycosylase [Gemmatimonadota bacterium]
MEINPSERAAIKRRLLAWYRREKRDLPWRDTDNPYHVLLSEFMLQQTQVDTVIPYYRRFLRDFPTVHALASTPRDRVLKAWEGLGYYTRARNLHRTAQYIVDRFDGAVPDAYDDLASLPGLGPYTTAAVLSIAYDRDYAVLDGNVIRVLCRLFGIQDDTRQTRTRANLQKLADNLLHRGDAGEYNQAIMELGATVCRPRAPRCGTCPVNGQCAALRADTVESLPVRAPGKPRPHYLMGVGIVSRNDTVLIVRRPENGLLGGLWEFPSARKMVKESLGETCIRAVREATGVHAAVRNRFRTVKHAFTHFSVTMHAFQCDYEGGEARAVTCSDVKWVAPGVLGDFAFSRANRKLIEFMERAELF